MTRRLSMLRTFIVSTAFILVLFALFQVVFFRNTRCINVRTVTLLKEKVLRNISYWERTLNFTGFDNERGTSDGHYIVPNYVHFIKFKSETFSFIHMVCVLAAFKHQRPEKLFIHTNVESFHGKYWEVLINTPGFKEVLVINRIKLPTEVFSQPLNPKWVLFHGGDVARLAVLRKYGGIYVDNDSYIIRSMDDLRRYELAVAWIPKWAMMNQVVIAHKDARLLKEWEEGYKDYKRDMWFYNAGRVPADILMKRPYYAHSVPRLLGTYDIRKKIYLEDWSDWKTYYSCHLMVRWVRSFKDVKYSQSMDEIDVLKYHNTLQAMVQDVYDIQRTVNKTTQTTSKS